jgi:hypothetical protein
MGDVSAESGGEVRVLSDRHITFSQYAEPERSQLVIRGSVRLAAEIAIPMSELATLGDDSAKILLGKAGVGIEQALRDDPLKFLVEIGAECIRLEAPRLLTRGEGDEPHETTPA